MSLTDVDKNSLDRSVPTPNHNDRIIDGATKAHGTNSVNYTTDATDTSTTTGIYTANKQLVRSGDIVITSDGTGGNTHTVSTFPHPLGYAPLVEGAFNNAAVTGISGPVNIPLPTWLAIDLSGASISFLAYTSIMVDASNIYVYTLNLTGLSVQYVITYYLYRQRAVN